MIVWRKGPEFRPPVIDLEDRLSQVIPINGGALPPDKEKTFQIETESSFFVNAGLFRPDAGYLHCLSSNSLPGRPEGIGIGSPEGGQIASFVTVSEFPQPLWVYIFERLASPWSK